MANVIDASSENADESRRDDGYVSLMDRGDMLFVRVKRAAGGSVPVTIAREAMEDHFGVGQTTADLAQAYLNHQTMINAKVLELDPAGSIYSDAFPMQLGTGDFS